MPNEFEMYTRDSRGSNGIMVSEPSSLRVREVVEEVEASKTRKKARQKTLR